MPITEAPLPKKFGKWFAPVGVAAVGSLVFASFSAAGLLNMTTAYFYIMLGWIIAVLVVFLSEYAFSFPANHKILLGILFVIISGIMASGLAYWEGNERYRLTHLIPDDLPTPNLSCKIPNNAFAVFLGNTNVTYFTNFPHDIIDMGRDPEGKPFPLLQIGKTGNSISINFLRVFDRDGNLLTRLHGDKIIPTENSNAYLNKVNNSTLRVFDEHDQEVMEVHILNSQAMKIVGVFRRPGFLPLIVNNNGIYFGRLSKKPILKDACVGAAGKYFVFE